MTKEHFMLDVAAVTDIGLIRESNEDSYAIDKKTGLFVLADGLGGHSGGEVASKLAVDTITTFFKRLPKEARESSVTKTIRNAVQAAHENIIKESVVNPILAGMGSTLVLALIRERTLYVANVGDSRAYLYHDNNLRLLSYDHSVVSELIKQGEITKDEARRHPQRNLVTQVIGINPFTDCYQKKLELCGGDIIMLCSDGLWDMISDKEIEEIIKNEEEPKNLCSDLINAAKDAGGRDNITIVVIKVRSNLNRKNKNACS